MTKSIIHDMIVLGIETTCDETAAAVVERSEDGRGRICPMSCCRRSTSTPRSAAWCPRSPPAPMSKRSTSSSPRRWRRPSLGFAALDGVAAAAGPGLIGGVIVGLTTAKAIALAHGKPLIAVNHLEAHALTRAADRRHAVSLSACSSPPAATPRSSRVRGVGDYVRLGTHGGRRDRRGLRQDGEAARPRLSGRTAGREGSGARRPDAVSRCRGRWPAVTTPIFRCRA